MWTLAFGVISQMGDQKVRHSLMKYVRVLTVQHLYLPLITDVICVEDDFVNRVRDLDLHVQVVHRNISFLWSEFFGVRPNCRIDSNLCFPSLLCA